MLQRHSLVWLSAAGWQRALATAPPDWQEDAQAWHRNDWPAVVRRPDANAPLEQPPQIALGLSAISVSGTLGGAKRKRLAVAASPDDILRCGMPVALSEAIASAPGRWRAGLAALAGATDDAGIALRTFGSLAWQHLTGAACMTARSDVDLLLYPVSASQLDQGLELLAAHAEQLPLDGEIVFPNGDAVAWKEWRQARASGAGCRVLVKHLRGVRLAPAATLLTMFS